MVLTSLNLGVCCVGLELFLIFISVTPSSPSVSKNKQNLEVDNYLDKLRNDVTTPPLDCGGRREVRLHETIFIESPHFSKKKKYPNSINCKWNFHLHHCTLAINCPNFSLNKFLCFDYLQVTDGLGRNKRFCGEEGPQNLYMEKNVTVIFKTSPSFSGTGFRCYAVCVEPGPVTHTELAAPSIPFSSLGHCVCGRGNRDRKFVTREKFPWVAQLFRKNDGQLFCTASLITNQYLLSASHCFASSESNDPSNIYVVLNEKSKTSANQKNGRGRPPGRNVSSIIRYQTDGLTYEGDADIALIKLEKIIHFDHVDVDTTQLSPVCLPKGEELTKQYVGVDTFSSQWTWDTQWEGYQLWNVKSKVVENENCASSYRKMGVGGGDSSTFCTQDVQSILHGSCRPISGAALMTAENKGRFSKFTQIGVGTWGHDCGQYGRYRKNIPRMYTKLTELMSWIFFQTQDSGFCKS